MVEAELLAGVVLRLLDEATLVERCTGWLLREGAEVLRCTVAEAVRCEDCVLRWGADVLTERCPCPPRCTDAA